MAKRIIMIGNYKGGSGETQTAVELSYWLASKGQHVLAIDLDHQANFSMILGRGLPHNKRSIPKILIDDDCIRPEDISSCSIDKHGHKIDYIASGLDAGRLEKKLPDDTVKEYLLKDALEEIKGSYDYIIMDTPPSAELISTCALIACNSILITTQAAVFSAEGVRGLIPVVHAVQSRPRMNPDLEFLGILITMYEATRDSRSTLEDLKNEFGGKVLEPYIRKTTKVKESNRNYLAVQSYAPTSTSARDYNLVFETLFREEINL